MVRITRVYTKKGDTGTSQITRSLRLSKNSLHIKLLGSLDEFNSYLGWCNILLDDKCSIPMKTRLLEVQNILFDLGAFLISGNKKNELQTLLVKLTATLEEDIDQMNKELTPLDSFILPGGDEITSRLHIARTVCRRMECKLVAFSEEKHETFFLSFINRLSDWLFVAARYNLMLTKNQELLWKPIMSDTKMSSASKGE
jgi:cob(I)alamin adenosyltransferase